MSRLQILFPLVCWQRDEIFPVTSLNFMQNVYEGQISITELRSYDGHKQTKRVNSILCLTRIGLICQSLRSVAHVK
jgi:hypothetical protein